MSSFKTILFAILALLPIAANANSPLEPKLAPALNCEAKLLTQQEQEALAESIAQQELDLINAEHQLANKQKELTEEKEKIAQSKLTLEANQAQDTSAYRGKLKAKESKAVAKVKGPSRLSQLLKKKKKTILYSTIFSTVLGLGATVVYVPTHYEEINGNWVKQIDDTAYQKAYDQIKDLNIEIQQTSLTPDEFVLKVKEKLADFKDPVYVDNVTPNRLADRLQLLVENYVTTQNLNPEEAVALGEKVFSILKDDYLRYKTKNYESGNYDIFNLYGSDSLKSVIHQNQRNEIIRKTALELEKIAQNNYDPKLSLEENLDLVIEKIKSNLSRLQEEELKKEYYDSEKINKILADTIAKYLEKMQYPASSLESIVKTAYEFQIKIETFKRAFNPGLFRNRYNNNQNKDLSRLILDKISSVLIEAINPTLLEISNRKMSYNIASQKISEVFSNIETCNKISLFPFQKEKYFSQLAQAANSYVFNNKEAIQAHELVEILKLFPRDTITSAEVYLLYHQELSSIQATEIINWYTSDQAKRISLYREFITRKSAE